MIVYSIVSELFQNSEEWRLLFKMTASTCRRQQSRQIRAVVVAGRRWTFADFRQVCNVQSDNCLCGQRPHLILWRHTPALLALWCHDVMMTQSLQVLKHTDSSLLNCLQVYHVSITQDSEIVQWMKPSVYWYKASKRDDVAEVVYSITIGDNGMDAAACLWLKHQPDQLLRFYLKPLWDKNK